MDAKRTNTERMRHLLQLADELRMEVIKEFGVGVTREPFILAGGDGYRLRESIRKAYLYVDATRLFLIRAIDEMTPGLDQEEIKWQRTQRRKESK